MILWFTGLSGAGKSTISEHVRQTLSLDHRVESLDGDVVRKTLCKDLGFSKEDRVENIRRISHLANSLATAGSVVLVSAISPYRESREKARHSANALNLRFVEVYVNAPLATCKERDPKGLYALACSGAIPSFTGISDPYESPLSPDVECNTNVESAECSASKVTAFVLSVLSKS
jgi:adenylylsulfate kinase